MLGDHLAKTSELLAEYPPPLKTAAFRAMAEAQVRAGLKRPPGCRQSCDRWQLIRAGTRQIVSPDLFLREVNVSWQCCRFVPVPRLYCAGREMPNSVSNADQAIHILKN